VHPAGGAAIDVESDLIADLADGRLGAAARRLVAGTVPSDDIAELLRAELTARRGATSVRELIELSVRMDERAAGSGNPALRWWAGALVGERGVVDCDIADLAPVAELLAEMPSEPLLPIPLLWVRARLRRLVGLARLYDPTPDRAAHRRLQSEAIADFSRCGFRAEIAITRCLGASVETLWLTEPPADGLARALDARADLDGVEASGWGPLLDMLIALTALLVGDLAAADRCLARLRTDRLADPARAWATAVRSLRAVVAADGTGPTLDALAADLDDLRRASLLGAQALRLAAGHVLADLGRGDAARRLAVPMLDMSIAHPIDALDHRVLSLRLRIHGGDAVGPAEIVAPLGEMRERGHGQRAAHRARQLAADLDAAGHPAHARSLRTWAATAPSLTPADLDPGTGGVVTGALTVRVLAPVLEVRRGGRIVALRSTAGRLLVHLVVRHPHPLHVEEAADALWPGIARDVARPRLNVVVYRLRRGLGPAGHGGHGGSVRRTSDLLALEPASWEVDLFLLRRATAATATRQERLAAARAVDGNLCHAQFPYDERLIEARRAIAADITQLLHHPDVRHELGTDTCTRIERRLHT
jgi:hypothetical protein